MTSAPYSRRSFPAGAVITTVPLGIGQFDASCVIYNADNWTATTGNFFVTVDYAMPTEEEIECSSISGTTVNFADRGSQGTTAVEHEAGCTIFVSHVPRDDDEANQVVSLLGNAVSGSLFVGAGASTLPSVLPVGSTGRVLTVVGGTPAWAGVGSPSMNAASIEASFNAAGQLYAGTGSGSGEQLAKGSAGQVLTVGGADASGLEWSAIPAWLTPTAQTSTYSANPGDLVQASATSAAFTVTVPITDGAITAVKKMDATFGHAVTIVPASGHIDGNTSLLLYGQYAGYVFVGDGTNANVVGVFQSNWQSYTPSWLSTGTAPAIGNGSVQGSFQQIGRRIEVQIYFAAGSTTTFGTGHYIFTAPVTSQTGLQWFGGGQIQDTSLYNIQATITGGGTSILMYGPASSTSTVAALVTPTVPVTWTTNNQTYLSVDYQI